MKKSIGAFVLNDNIFLNSKRTTSQGMAILAEPIYKLSLNDDSKVIGEKVRMCIESYNDDKLTPHPTRGGFKTINDPLIKLAGEKNSKSFFTKIKDVEVVLVDKVLYFTPTENHGWKEGFKKTKYPNIELDYSTATDEDLGKALLKAFELSSIV
jgi:hypothetical protein